MPNAARGPRAGRDGAPTSRPAYGPEPPADPRGALVLTAAAELHAAGQETPETVSAADRLGRALGLAVTLVPRWGDVWLQAEAEGRVRLRLRPATPNAVHMRRVAAVMGVVDAVGAGSTSAADAERALAAAARVPGASAPAFVLACMAGASALALIFGVAHPPALVLIAVSAGLGGALRRYLAALGGGAMLQAFAAALLAGLVGALAVRWDVSSALRLVAVCPCMILVPGPHLLNGALDLVALRVPLGASRLTFAGMVLLAIGTGLLIGLALGGTSLPAFAPGRAVPLWLDTLAAGAAAASYGVYFSMPPRMLGWPVVTGMVAHAARWWALSVVGVTAAAGAGLACLVVGAILVPFAARFRLPFAAVGFASVVSLMPGVFVFRLMSGLVQLQQHAATAPSLLARDTFTDALTAVLIVFAMTLGLVVPKRVYQGLGAWHASRRGGAVR